MDEITGNEARRRQETGGEKIPCRRLPSGRGFLSLIYKARAA